MWGERNGPQNLTKFSMGKHSEHIFLIRWTYMIKKSENIVHEFQRLMECSLYFSNGSITLDYVMVL